MLSEFSSEEDSKKNFLIFPGIYLFEGNEKEERGDFIEQVVNDELDDKNRRLLNIYWH